MDINDLKRRKEREATKSGKPKKAKAPSDDGGADQEDNYDDDDFNWENSNLNWKSIEGDQILKIILNV